ncbi:MAG: GGDEF domain-containing protein [Thermoleophilia bacterium]
MVEFSERMNTEDQTDDLSVVAHKAGISLKKREEQITKKWLKAMIDDMELKSLQAFPTELLSAGLPQLIGCIARSIREPAIATCESHELGELAARLATLRKGAPAATQVFDDYAMLKYMFIEAAAMDLRSSDVRAMQVFQRLDASFMNFFKAGMEAFMDQHSRELQQMANTDPLTGLFNVRYFRQQLHRNLEMFKRYGVPFSLMMLDIDKLKQLNDTTGHEAGDNALKLLADVLMKEKREVDVAFRCGGDEFFLILPGTVIEDVETVAERVIQKLSAGIPGTDAYMMTSVSIGIVSCPRDGTDVGSLRARVDQALYHAKKAGGGAVSRYLEPESDPDTNSGSS